MNKHWNGDPKESGSLIALFYRNSPKTHCSYVKRNPSLFLSNQKRWQGPPKFSDKLQNFLYCVEVFKTNLEKFWDVWDKLKTVFLGSITFDLNVVFYFLPFLFKYFQIFAIGQSVRLAFLPILDLIWSPKVLPIY